MPISAGGGLFASAPRGAVDPPAVSDGTRVADNAISVAASARLGSLSSPGIHSDASSAHSRRSGSSRQSPASPLYGSDSDGEGINNATGVHAMIHGSAAVGSGPARPAVRRSARGQVPSTRFDAGDYDLSGGEDTRM